jgi:hypothetical protein
MQRSLEDDDCLTKLPESNTIIGAAGIRASSI